MLVFFLVVLLLLADAFVFFVVGLSIDTMYIINNLKKKGWTVEPPEIGKE